MEIPQKAKTRSAGKANGFRKKPALAAFVMRPQAELQIGAKALILAPSG
jgi:hypothetical protein